MGFKSFLKGAIAAATFAAFGAGAALAQSCVETEVSGKVGELYLKAENEHLVNNNHSAAASIISQLRNMQLNCYEKGVVTRLSASISIKQGNYQQAVRDLEAVAGGGGLPREEQTKLYYNIAQLYLQADNMAKSRDYFNRWIQGGGRPTRDDNWRLAVLNEKLGDQRQAVGFAEKVLATDGSGAKKEVFDFLIYLYDKTGQSSKQAALLERLLAKDPTDRKLWEIISGNYYKAKDERKAFEVQKAMYHAGLLTKEDELMRIVNFYNRFNAPYPAAKILEKEMNKGRISENLEKLELLANLYQVAREHEKAIPVIQKAANKGGGGAMLERLGRSYADLQQWEKAEAALTKAISSGAKNKGLSWVLIGQSRYERQDRAGAREAFRNANNRGGRGWLDFMQSEDNTEKALRVFEKQQAVFTLNSEKESCDRLKILGDNLPEGCATVDVRIEEAQAEVARVQGAG